MAPNFPIPIISPSPVAEKHNTSTTKVKEKNIKSSPSSPSLTNNEHSSPLKNKSGDKVSEIYTNSSNSINFTEENPLSPPLSNVSLQTTSPNLKEINISSENIPIFQEVTLNPESLTHSPMTEFSTQDIEALSGKFFYLLYKIRCNYWQPRTFCNIRGYRQIYPPPLFSAKRKIVFQFSLKIPFFFCREFEKR